MTSPSTQAHPDSERAETYLRLQAEAELRAALGLPRYERAHETPARECLHRVGRLACVLAGAGTMDDSTARAVVEDFNAALAARLCPKWRSSAIPRAA